MAELTATQERLLDYLPIYYGGVEDPDPVVARWLNAQGFELDRLRGVFELLRDSTVPSAATDALGQLGRWERALGMPIAPADATPEQRRAKLIARLRARRVTRGLDWTEVLTSAIGSSQWRAYRNTPGPNQLTIEIPYAPGSYNAGQVEAIAREMTPAAVQIVMRYSQGFVVGVSRVGEDAI